jgi:outer membrane protein
MMRSIHVHVLTAAVLLGAGSAQATASFANRELGLGVGGFSLLPPGADLISWGLPLTLEGGLYLENGFALYLHIPLMLLQQTGASQPGTVLGTGGQFGVRYLFLEESIRPYVMLHLAGLYFFRDSSSGTNFYAGPGTGFGVDFFVAESISLGVRASVDLFLTLAQAQLTAVVSLGGGVYVTTYF